MRSQPLVRLFDSFFTDSLPEVFPGPLTPATSIVETPTSFLVSFDLPGIDEQDIQLDLQEGNLTVSAERKEQATAADATWHRREQRHGQWSRTIVLPESANPQAIEATYRRGVLEVVVQKHPKSLPTRVPIKGA